VTRQCSYFLLFDEIIIGEQSEIITSSTLPQLAEAPFYQHITPPPPPPRFQGFESKIYPFTENLRP